MVPHTKSVFGTVCIYKHRQTFTPTYIHTTYIHTYLGMWSHDLGYVVNKVLENVNL
jgi:hypothetical protein